MKWLEIISLRSAGNGIGGDDEIELGETLFGSRKEEGLKKIRLYRHASLGRDISLHLFHEGSRDEVRKSELGLRLAASLKESGLVSHSLWVLEENRMKSPITIT